MTTKEKKSLRGQAHSLKPVVQLGQQGLSDNVVGAVTAALLQHELIKVRMQEPEDKVRLATSLAEKTESLVCGLIGHTVILYKAHPDPEKRRIAP